MAERAPIVHDIKCWPPFFAAIRDGLKPFEVRKNDRDYRTGDTLRLWEYDPEAGQHTGKYFHRSVTYVLAGGQFGVEADHVVMGFGNSAPPPAAPIEGGTKVSERARISTDKMAQLLFSCSPRAGFFSWDSIDLDERDDWRDEAAKLRDAMHEAGYTIIPTPEATEPPK